MNTAARAAPGRLGDTPERDYSRKLRLFNAFAEPELRQAIAGLELTPGLRILDAGCGTGEALQWLAAAAGPGAQITGIDLSRSHVTAAQDRASSSVRILQADLLQAPLAPASLDLIWCVNTLNHLHDPVEGVRALAALLHPGGRIAVGQSSLVADMYFAWDARLERVVTEAVRRYYRDRYHLSEHELTGVRSLAGWLREAGLREIQVRTLMIERITPLDEATEAYLREAIFRGTWGERLRPYLSEADNRELAGLCDPDSAQYALHRPDFHFLQSFTLAVGRHCP
jgi:SAM-dependent methyltransferase